MVLKLKEYLVKTHHCAKNDRMFLQNWFESIIVKVESYPSFFCGHGKSSIVAAITPMRSTTWCQELWMKKNPSPFNLEGTVQCGVFLSKLATKGHLISNGLFSVFNSSKKWTKKKINLTVLWYLWWNCFCSFFGYQKVLLKLTVLYHHLFQFLCLRLKHLHDLIFYTI